MWPAALENDDERQGDSGALGDGGYSGAMEKFA